MLHCLVTLILEWHFTLIGLSLGSFAVITDTLEPIPYPSASPLQSQEVRPQEPSPSAF